MSGVLVCTTCGDQPHPRYWMSLNSLRGDFSYKPLHGKMGVDDGHNRLIDGFLQSDFEWMLHLDADAVVHPLTLKRMLSWNEPFVTALAFQRKPPYLPVYYSEGDGESSMEWKRQIDETRAWLLDNVQESCTLNRPVVMGKREGALRPVHRGGAHCLLCHRDVFEAIEPPWFERYGAHKKRGSGSDFYFYDQAKQAGFTPMIDLGVIAGHLQGDWSIGAPDFLTWDTVTDITHGEEKMEITYRFNE